MTLAPEILRKLEFNEPAAAIAISKAEGDLRVKLPSDYVRFWHIGDGAVGPIGTEGFLQLWRVEELKPFNDAESVNEYAPGLILFGSNGGGTGYAFDTHDAMAVVDVPFIGMSRAETRRLAANFSAFLALMAKQ